MINLNLLFWAIVGGGIVLYFVWQLVQVILPVLLIFLIAMLVAFLLGSLVSKLEAIGMPRGLAVAVVYLGLLGIIFGLGSLVIRPLTQQISSLTSLFDSKSGAAQIRHVINNANTILAQHHIPISLNRLQSQGIAYAQQFGSKLLGGTLDFVLNVSQILIDVLAIIVISLYLLIDGARLRHNILRVIPEKQRSGVVFVEVTVRTVVGSYVRGQVILALIIGVMAGIGSFVLQIHYPLVIAAMAGVFELVPMLGPILGAIPAIIIALFQSWQLAVATVVMFIIIQQLEAHVIAPRIMGRAVGVHPIVAILAVLLGTRLDGLLGALTAVPIAGVFYVLAQAVYSEVTGQHTMVTVERNQPFYVRLFHTLRGDPARTEVVQQDDSLTVTVEAPSAQLASIVHERDQLVEEFETAEKIAREANEDEVEEPESQSGFISEEDAAAEEEEAERVIKSS